MTQPETSSPPSALRSALDELYKCFDNVTSTYGGDEEDIIAALNLFETSLDHFIQTLKETSNELTEFDECKNEFVDFFDSETYNIRNAYLDVERGDAYCVSLNKATEVRQLPSRVVNVANVEQPPLSEAQLRMQQMRQTMTEDEIRMLYSQAVVLSWQKQNQRTNPETDE